MDSLCVSSPSGVSAMKIFLISVLMVASSILTGTLSAQTLTDSIRLDVRRSGAAVATCVVNSALGDQHRGQYSRRLVRFPLTATAVIAAARGESVFRYVKSDVDSVLVREVDCRIPSSAEAVDEMFVHLRRGTSATSDAPSGCTWSDDRASVSCWETYVPVCPSGYVYDPKISRCIRPPTAGQMVHEINGARRKRDASVDCGRCAAVPWLALRKLNTASLVN